MAFVLWLIGDVHELTWVWGAVGEEQTAEVLEMLDAEWTCAHDLTAKRGNFDHVVVGPAGVFLLDTKSVSRRAVASAEGLSAGRFHFAAGRLRGAAAELGEQLQTLSGRRPWVQSVVVIWGDFPQLEFEGQRVVYLHGTRLVPWLRQQPHRLNALALNAFREGLQALSGS